MHFADNQQEYEEMKAQAALDLQSLSDLPDLWERFREQWLDSGFSRW